MSGRRPRLLLLSMYPLDQGMWGATARIRHVRDERSKLVELDVVPPAVAALTAASGRVLGAAR